MKRLSLIALLIAGCAHTSQNVTKQPEQEAEEPRHGMKGASEPIPLPHRVIDSKTGDELSPRSLDERLQAARVIFVGEEHTNPHDHAAELEVLEAAYKADPSLGFGFEMLPRSFQGSLEAYVAGKIDEQQFLKAVDWEHNWGFAWGLYKPLLEFCRAHHLPAYALNAPHDLAHTVAFKGLDALTAEQRAELPQLQPGPAAHREMVREAFAQHPHSRFDKQEFEHFYEAQLVWDETMADRIAAALSAEGAPKRMVVVAGEGHTQRFAVPARAERRGVTPVLTVLPVLDRDEADARADDVADLLWVLRTTP